MSGHENDLGDIRWAFTYDGVIVAREDPLDLGRVKVRIPGLFETSSPWCFPVGMPGAGGKQRGAKWVPPLGAEVAVYFRGGDPNQPRYMAGHWGRPNGESEIPTDAKDQDHSEDIHALETDHYAVTIDDRPGKERMVFKDKVSGDSIEFDGTSATGPGILIKATAALVIQVDGAFSVEAAMIILNGRKLGEGTGQF